MNWPDGRDAARPDEPDGSTDGNGRKRDAGSLGAALLAWLLLLPLLTTVVVMQHSSGPPAAPTSAVAPPDPMEPMSIMSKLAVKMSRMMPAPSSTSSGSGGSGPSGGPSATSGSPGASSADPALAGSLMPHVDELARTPIERLRAAVVAGELVGTTDAQVRLEKVRAELADRDAGKLSDAAAKEGEAGTGEKASEGKADVPSGEEAALSKDEIAARAAEEARVLDESLRILSAMYEKGDASTLTEADRTFLVEHHGWYGKLAQAYGRPDTDPARRELVSGGLLLVLLLVFAGLVMIGLILAGFALLITAVVMRASGRLRGRFVPPAAGGSVYLETVVVFLMAFLLLKGATWLLEHQFGHKSWIGPVQMLLQWAVLPAIFWPVVRGVRWPQLRRDMGWYAPRGVWREIGAGILGYIAGVPVFLAGVLFTLTALAVREAIRQATGGGTGEPAPPPENPIIDVVARGDVLMLMLLYVLASVWAPIVEEAVFRGAFYRHLRGRLPVVLAALATALVFAVMHGYEFVLLGPVFALGFNFALMREWRGSLIAPMTAHAIHNGVTLALVITMVRLLG